MSNPKPFAFSPSELWDGNNGNWSSFIVRIGTPEQDFRVLPSAATGATFVPDYTGCNASDPYNCAQLRGVVNSSHSGFQPNASQTWVEEGPFEAHVLTELNYNARALYGRDKVGLAGLNSGAPDLEDQVVGSLDNKRPFLVGYFGLSPKPLNFSDFYHPRPSYLTSLKDARRIPSLSYGYTAGAFYKQTLGSLTLGGYDDSRFTSNNVTFPFYLNNERSTSLSLQHLTADNTPNGTVSLLPSGKINVNLDFTMPYLWLPVDTCNLIESIFKLTYDDSSRMYLVEDGAHAELLSKKPTFTFELSNPQDLAESVSIVISYAAFDLQASWPFYNGTKNYFPIKRAANDSQYTIGRAFMQEAYMIVDYERKSFSVHQAMLPPPQEQKLVAIAARHPEFQGEGIHLSKASIAGITIGSIFCLVAVLVACFLYYRRKQQSHKAAQQSSEDQSASEDVETMKELSGHVFIQQIMSTDVMELESIGRCNSHRAELEGGAQELAG